MDNRYIALIPAYEPGPELLDILKQLHDAGFCSIVIDDGSGSDYADLFAEAASFATILTHTVNQGKGVGLKTGLSYIQEHFEEKRTIVTMDADGQHRVEDALSLCALADKYPNELILGSRSFKGNVPLRSQFGNTATRIVYRLSTGLKVHDTQSGLRAFSSELIPEMLNISGERYEYEMNVLLEFARKKIPIRETEIQTIYIQENASSHFHAAKDSYRIYKEILKFSASSFIAFLLDYCIYGILLFFTSNLWLSNIGARIVSATTNYTINRKFVFKSDSGVTKSAIQYFLLAASILVGNTLVLGLLVNVCGVHQMLAKILTELMFFLLNWTVQKFVIFRKSQNHKK